MAGLTISPLETSIFKIVQVLIGVLVGRSNSVGQVTLRANQTTTTVTKAVDPAAVNVSLGQEIFLSPRTANAAAAVATTFVSVVGQGTFTLTHANNAQVDKLFGFEARG